VQQHAYEFSAEQQSELQHKRVDLHTAVRSPSGIQCNFASYLHHINILATQEAILAYFVIWKWDVGITREELDAACEYLLQKMFNIETDFQGEFIRKKEYFVSSVYYVHCSG